MFKQWCGSLFILCILMVLGFYADESQPLKISSHFAHQIGLQIWKNECGGKQEGLTTWNKGEEFASLGIGHFIWYPANQQKIFSETFPELLTLFKHNGVVLPDWLEKATACPWQTREQFQNDQNEKHLVELRELLYKNIELQVSFMIHRLHKALSIILKNSPPSLHSHLTFQFYRLALTPDGIYVLLDYLNFKGEGTASQESYKGKGWGLMQVLEQLQGSQPGKEAVLEFVDCAKKILEERVENSPPERQEKRWLKGWLNRLDTYLQFSLQDSTSY